MGRQNSSEEDIKRVRLSGSIVCDQEEMLNTPPPRPPPTRGGPRIYSQETLFINFFEPREAETANPERAAGSIQFEPHQAILGGTRIEDKVETEELALKLRLISPDSEISK